MIETSGFQIYLNMIPKLFYSFKPLNTNKNKLSHRMTELKQLKSTVLFIFNLCLKCKNILAPKVLETQAFLKKRA
jgi:hypothetical protein